MSRYTIVTAVSNTTIWTFWLRYVIMCSDWFHSFAITTACLDALWNYYFARITSWNQAFQAYKWFEVFVLGLFIGGYIYFSQMLLQDFSKYATILFLNAASFANVGLVIAELEIDLWWCSLFFGILIYFVTQRKLLKKN